MRNREAICEDCFPVVSILVVDLLRMSQILLHYKQGILLIYQMIVYRVLLVMD